MFKTASNGSIPGINVDDFMDEEQGIGRSGRSSRVTFNGAYNEIKAGLDEEVATSSLRSRPNKPIIRANTIRRTKHLKDMSESDLAKNSEGTTLRLDEFTKVANKKEVRTKNNTHSLSGLFCSSGAMSFEWMEHCVYAVIALVCMIIFGQSWAFPDGLDVHGEACGNFRVYNWTHCEEYTDSCSSGLPTEECQEWLETENPCGGFKPNDAFCALGGTLNWGFNQFKFLTPFVLGGYVVSTVSLWRTRRTSYLALCGAVRNMNVNLGSIVPLPWHAQDNSVKAKLKYARATLSRWSLLGFELSVLKARGLIDNEEAAVPHLSQLGLLKEGEWNAMVPGDRHTTIWLWMQTLVMHLGHELIIDSTQVQTICFATTLIRDRANDLMSSLNNDQPFPYASIVGLLVNFTLLMDALWNAHIWAQWLFETGWSIFTQPKMWLELIILLISCMLFGMLYDLSHILYNPFGARSIDLPHQAVGGGIRKMARSFATGDFLPPTIELPESLGENGMDASTTSRYDNFDEEAYFQATTDHLTANKRGSLFAGISKRW